MKSSLIAVLVFVIGAAVTLSIFGFDMRLYWSFLFGWLSMCGLMVINKVSK